VGIIFLMASVAAPLALVVMVAGPIQRWIALGCLAAALVNSAAIAAVLQKGQIPQLKLWLAGAPPDQAQMPRGNQSKPVAAAQHPSGGIVDV
jgi:hypothetical protein